jgi:Family of unknown function (DUF5681)
MEMTGVAVDSLYKQRRRAGGRPFQKGQSGNLAGRPPGSRNRTTLAAESLLEGEAQALTRTAIKLALAGDTTALRLCLERIVPQRKSRAVSFEAPRIDGIQAPGHGDDRARAAAAGAGSARPQPCRLESMASGAMSDRIESPASVVTVPGLGPEVATVAHALLGSTAKAWMLGTRPSAGPGMTTGMFRADWIRLQSTSPSPRSVLSCPP